MGIAVSKTQDGMFKQSDNTGLLEDTDFGLFINRMKTETIQPSCALAGLNYFNNLPAEEESNIKKSKGIKQYLPGEMPRMGGNMTEFIGTALFDGGKMVGTLTGEENRALMMIRGEFVNGSFAINDPIKPDKIDTIEIEEVKKPEIKIQTNEKPEINVKLFLEGDIQAIQSGVQYEMPDKMVVLEKAFTNYITEVINETVHKCQELGCDVFGFGEWAVKKFPTIQQWEEYEWLNKFKDASINVQVEFNIRRTGTLLKTNPEKSSEGGE